MTFMLVYTSVPLLSIQGLFLYVNVQCRGSVADLRSSRKGEREMPGGGGGGGGGGCS